MSTKYDERSYRRGACIDTLVKNKGAVLYNAMKVKDLDQDNPDSSLQWLKKWLDELGVGDNVKAVPALEKQADFAYINLCKLYTHYTGLPVPQEIMYSLIQRPRTLADYI